MRLDKIKLAGFKSFVDPTVLELRSPLVAIVGPNGCGKSNVIDAVRWVMGESSAKNLRGESMSDVIFNGSTTRKPVGRASIELIFDNSDGSLGGEYAQFSEVSVKREASRDNQSSYFLNNVRCRRRDITDIFLGTGLGARSYSIIEQGMISRVIEAKPEDLRAFFEEAAGISLYRRRRQETETRMRHTRENLERLDDVRLELDKSLERLKRQSEAALRYQELKKEQDQIDAELAALRWHAFKEQIEEKTVAVRALSTSLEEKMAEKTNNELALEKLREESVEKTVIYDEIHEKFYELGTLIARNEQTLEHNRERNKQIKTDLEEALQTKEKIDHELKEDKAHVMNLLEEENHLLPTHDALQKHHQESLKNYEDTRDVSQKFQENFEKFQEDASKTQQTAEVEKARIEQLEKQSREADNRLNRLRQELTTFNFEELESQLEATLQEIRSNEILANEHREALNELTKALSQGRTSLEGTFSALDESKEKRQTLKGRLASLETLQQAALGRNEGALKEWMELSNCYENKRLGEDLIVSPGYERAVETVLGLSIEAVYVDNIEEKFRFVEKLREGVVTLFEPLTIESHEAVESQGTIKAPPLADFVSLKTIVQNKQQHTQHPQPIQPTQKTIDSFLSGIYVVDEWNEAMALRSLLKSHESIVTKDGLWFGPNWLKVFRDQNNHQGILEREKSIETLHHDIRALNKNIEQLSEKLETEQSHLQINEEKRETHLLEEAKIAKLLKELTGKSSSLKARLDHIRIRLTKVEEEMAEQKSLLQLAEQATAEARLSLHDALDKMADFKTRKESLLQERETLNQLRREAEKSYSETRDKCHALTLKIENLKTERKAKETGIERLLGQHKSIQERIQLLSKSLEDNEEPYQTLREDLEELLAERLKQEEKLNLARSIVDALNNELQILEKRRGIFEQEGEAIRTKLDQNRMDRQALEVRAQTVQEKLESLSISVDEIYRHLSHDANESVWSERLESIGNKIQKLGAINLAAIEELGSESERKNYLDAQHQDLTSALETLENAIRKIDRETRAKFKETFDKVDIEFKRLFPRLFGGGEAYLELLGEDLLEAGVSVMARPPGKRNSSIHLLSGGEKALTAVALVFAIFQLNPAPFCMLDEVDAPLDDANVGRFSEMVKEMSSSVQFIYITHNKLSMEMAHHLIGVTMKEPGVSRLVSVDVAEAYELATA